MATKPVKVPIVGDATHLKKELDKSAGQLDGFASQAKKSAANFVGAFAVAGFFKAGIDELKQAAQVSAQTSAALASTGGAAGVSADHIKDLSGELMQLSGVDDEVIQASENLLLQFTNIKNAAGEGNDIFDQTAKASLDLAVALGIDATDAAGKLGKALQDPLAAGKALRGLNVLLTASQKESIKSFLEAGDVMSAQKVILEQVERQVGGSAEAYGKTLPGQIDKAKESFSNLAGAVVGTLAPALEALAGFAKILFDAFQALPQGLQTAIVFAGLAAIAWGKLGLSFDAVAIQAYNATGALSAAAAAAAPFAAPLIALTAVIFGAAFAFTKLAEAAAEGDFGTFSKDIDRVDASLKELGTTGRVIGILAEQLPSLAAGFESTNSGLGGFAEKAADIGGFLPGLAGDFSLLGSTIDKGFDTASAEDFEKQVDTLDQRLKELFKNDPATATAAYAGLKNELILLGRSGEEVDAGFDDFNTTQSDAKAAAEGTTGAITEQVDAMKALNDLVRAQTDPFFKLTKAYDDNAVANIKVEEAQLKLLAASQAVNDAIANSGPNSYDAAVASAALEEAQRGLTDAQLGAADSGFDLEEAERTLTAMVQDGGTTAAEAAAHVQYLADKHVITQGTADTLKQKFYDLTGAINTTPTDHNTNVTASGLEYAIDGFRRLSANIYQSADATAYLNAQTGAYLITKGAGTGTTGQAAQAGPSGAGGMYVPGPAGQPQLAVVHGGEEIVPASRAGRMNGSMGGDVYLDGTKVGKWMEKELARRVGAGR